MRQFFIIFAACIAVNSGRTQAVVPAILNSGTTKGNVGNLSFEFSLGEMATTTITNGNIVTQGFLQPMVMANNSPLPVLGLDFNARRTSSKQVQLDWKTLQEISNKGFSVERKRENESDFTSIQFIASKANGGNSSMPLTYSTLDTNVFAGKTYYRLKQQDLSGQSSFSVIRSVNGDVAKTITLKVWPVPAREFYIRVESNELEIVRIIDVAGRVVRTYVLTKDQTVLVTDLHAGNYFVQLQNKPDVIQKVIVN